MYFFQNFTEQEKNLFQTIVDVKGTCDTCLLQQEKHFDTFVYVLSERLCPELTLNADTWPCVFENLLDEKLFCTNCDKSIAANRSCHINMPDIMLLEIGTPTLLNVCTFFEQITVKNFSYDLRALVRNTGAHFTCAFSTQNKWIYIDDLKQDRIVYDNANDILRQQQGGWFFSVYLKSDVIDFAVTDRNTHVNSCCTDNLKEYSLRKRNGISYKETEIELNKTMKFDQEIFQAIDKKVKHDAKFKETCP